MDFSVSQEVSGVGNLDGGWSIFFERHLANLSFS